MVRSINKHPLSLLPLLLLFVEHCHAQLVGVDICACQPSVYRFKLDFNLTCPDGTVSGPGIVETACIVETRDASVLVTNPKPVRVTQIQILELGQDLAVVSNTLVEEDVFDGNEVEYTSVTKRDPSIINNTTLPKGFQVFITGVNSDEETLVNQFAISYANDCGIFPLLEVGDRIGWIEFVSTAFSKVYGVECHA